MDLSHTTKRWTQKSVSVAQAQLHAANDAATTTAAAVAADHERLQQRLSQAQADAARLQTEVAQLSASLVAGQTKRVQEHNALQADVVAAKHQQQELQLKVKSCLIDTSGSTFTAYLDVAVSHKVFGFHKH